MKKALAAAFVSLLLLAGLFSGQVRAGWLDNFLQELGSSSAERQSNQTRSPDAVAAVRGLGEVSAGDKDKRNYSAIKKLDEIKISDQELQKFIKEGKLAR